MDYLPNIADALQYSHSLDLYHVPQDGFNTTFDNPSFAVPDLTYPFDMQSNFPLEADPPAAADEFMSPSIPSAMPPLYTGAVNDSNTSSSTTNPRTSKVHPCPQCDKVYPRVALAEGCVNRHENRKPFHCKKHCGDPNWYVTYFFG
jgi:hypothetical protein